MTKIHRSNKTPEQKFLTWVAQRAPEIRPTARFRLPDKFDLSLYFEVPWTNALLLESDRYSESPEERAIRTEAPRLLQYARPRERIVIERLIMRDEPWETVTRDMGLSMSALGKLRQSGLDRIRRKCRIKCKPHARKVLL